MLQNYLLVGALLFALGLVGFLVRRNLIVMFLCAEMMLQGVSLSLVAWGRYHNDWGGQMLVLFIIAVAACEAGIALALILILCRQLREPGPGDLAERCARKDDRRTSIGKFPRRKSREEHWPVLTPAGVPPEIDPQQEQYRSHV